MGYTLMYDTSFISPPPTHYYPSGNPFNIVMVESSAYTGNCILVILAAGSGGNLRLPAILVVITTVETYIFAIHDSTSWSIFFFPLFYFWF